MTLTGKMSFTGWTERELLLPLSLHPFVPVHKRIYDFPSPSGSHVHQRVPIRYNQSDRRRLINQFGQFESALS